MKLCLVGLLLNETGVQKVHGYQDEVHGTVYGHKEVEDYYQGLVDLPHADYLEEVAQGNRKNSHIQSDQEQARAEYGCLTGFLVKSDHLVIVF